jgi:hypothetical protein
MYHVIELCEETDFSEISSGSEDGTVSLGNTVGRSGTMGIVTGVV